MLLLCHTAAVIIPNVYYVYDQRMCTRKIKYSAETVFCGEKTVSAVAHVCFACTTTVGVRKGWSLCAERGKSVRPTTTPYYRPILRRGARCKTSSRRPRDMTSRLPVAMPSTRLLAAAVAAAARRPCVTGGDLLRGHITAGAAPTTTTCRPAATGRIVGDAAGGGAVRHCGHSSGNIVV